MELGIDKSAGQVCPVYTIVIVKAVVLQPNRFRAVALQLVPLASSVLPTLLGRLPIRFIPLHLPNCLDFVVSERRYRLGVYGAE